MLAVANTIESFSERVDELCQSRNQASRVLLRPRITCFRCYREGHMAHECTQDVGNRGQH